MIIWTLPPPDIVYDFDGTLSEANKDSKRTVKFITKTFNGESGATIVMRDIDLNIECWFCILRIKTLYDVSYINSNRKILMSINRERIFEDIGLSFEKMNKDNCNVKLADAFFLIKSIFN
jgi:hypothetical protein